MASPIEITLILCDAAVADPGGKVHMLGAGWSVTGVPTAPHAVAILLGVPWDRANQKIPLTLTLCDDDGHPVEVQAPDDGKTAAIRHQGDIEVGRPAGLAAGSTLDAGMAISVPPLQLQPGRYQWRLEISDQLVTRSFTARA